MSVGQVESGIRSLEDYRKTLTEYAKALQGRAGDNKLPELSKLRAFDTETIKEADIFYINSMSDMLLPDYIDKVEGLGVISEANKKPIFNERWVFPIKAPSGEVENFVGYSPFANERYIYGTSTYYRRRDTLYGLENLQMAYEMGYAFVTEGITDTIRLRDIGYPNSFAMCGTHKSDHIIKVLNRCRFGVILIPDRDDAGIRALKNWKFNRSATILINLQFKDVDEMCTILEENGAKRKNEELINVFKEYADACIRWITSEEHNGRFCHCEKITIL